ncbi:hypothetical protein H6G45_12780 [Synechocystis sp. FACHB-383]|uniref:hypothetical protein n=1 Tax=Synechocystis sp. FACHB-383 TaxID=2692864 RepID=UPI0016891F7C|nr:hypothetical protein [Synechocystis sp. FACHB-383]MBD2654339.1 hypothetical protein [Synechocystis sp. FACHB-383]
MEAEQAYQSGDYIPLEEYEESLVMRLFLDFLMKTAINQTETLVPYSKTMSAEIDQLLAGVTVE